jgi:hypothetical protein
MEESTGLIAVSQAFAKLCITHPLRSICPALWCEPLPTTTAEGIVDAGVRFGAGLADVSLYGWELTGLAEAVAAVSGGTARVTRHGLLQLRVNFDNEPCTTAMDENRRDAHGINRHRGPFGELKKQGVNLLFSRCL